MAIKTEIDKQIEKIQKENRSIRKKIDAMPDLPKHSMASASLQDMEAQILALEKEQKNEARLARKQENLAKSVLAQSASKIKHDDRILSDLNLIEDTIESMIKNIKILNTLKSKSNPEIIIPETREDCISEVKEMVFADLKDNKNFNHDQLPDWSQFETVEAVLEYIKNRRAKLAEDLQKVVDELKSNDKDWYLKRGFTGLKLHCIKSNYVIDEYVKGKKFPAKKSKKAKAI